MPNPPAFQLFASDFYMDTHEWEDFEVGIYTRLLLSEWVNGTLPNDEKKLIRIAGTTQKRFQRAFRTLKMKFNSSSDGRLYNPRMEQVREIQRKFRELQSNRGKLSAKKRATMVQTVVPTVVQPGPLTSGYQPEGNSSSSSNNIGSSNSLQRIDKEGRIDLKVSVCDSNFSNPTKKASKKMKSSKRIPLPVEEFISELKKNPAYSHIDIDMEIHKMKAWFLTPKGTGRQLTSRFILNWIQKIQKPMEVFDHGLERPPTDPLEKRAWEAIKRINADRAAKADT